VLTCTELLGYSLVLHRLYQHNLDIKGFPRELSPDTLCVTGALHIAQFLFQF